MKDWIQQTNSQGNKTWINIRSLKDQKEHPALKSFRTNKKILRDKADTEFNCSITHYTNFKQVLEEFSETNHRN